MLIRGTLHGGLAADKGASGRDLIFINNYDASPHPTALSAHQPLPESAPLSQRPCSTGKIAMPASRAHQD
jgi:hypothetical protein